MATGHTLPSMDATLKTTHHLSDSTHKSPLDMPILFHIQPSHTKSDSPTQYIYPHVDRIFETHRAPTLHTSYANNATPQALGRSRRRRCPSSSAWSWLHHLPVTAKRLCRGDGPMASLINSMRLQHHAFSPLSAAKPAAISFWSATTSFSTAALSRGFSYL